MKKINVLFVIIQMGLGGSEQLVLNIIRGLDRKRFSPSVAWFFGETILDEFADLNIPLFYVPKNKSLDFHTMQHFSDILRDNDIHVVNAHHYMSMVYSFYGCKVKKQARLIYTEHSEWEIEAIRNKWQLIGIGLLRCVDKAVGVSSAVSDALKKKFFLPSKKVTTIQNGVDLNVFSGAAGKEEFKKELGLDASEKVIGVVANLKKVKNHLFLLRAFREVVDEFANVTLLIVGQGFADDPDNTETDIRSFIAENGLDGKVKMMGYRSDIPRLLSVMDVFCLTSNMEGLPISLIEAMATGLPVVGSDVPGIRDVIQESVNGFIVPLDDKSSLKSAILTLLLDDSLKHNMGEQSKVLAGSYSMRSCIESYSNLFSPALEG